ncbi:hypothetical protein [Mesorhizobium sp. WSM3860]|nr:hypothetical protein [Mesorhizobium sp. WSM3860]
MVSFLWFGAIADDGGFFWEQVRKQMASSPVSLSCLFWQLEVYGLNSGF